MDKPVAPDGDLRSALVFPFLQIAFPGTEQPADRAECRPEDERQPLDCVAWKKEDKDHLVLPRTAERPLQLLPQRVRRSFAGDAKRLQDVGTERIDIWNIGRVAHARHDDPADSGHIVAGR